MGEPEGQPQTKSLGWARLRLGLGLVVTAAIIMVLVRNLAGTGDFLARVESANPWWGVAAFLVGCVSVGLSGLRWQWVLQPMGYRLPFTRVLSSMLAAWPPILIMPARANEVLRAWAVRDLLPLSVGMSSVVAERVLDLIVLFAMAGVGGAALGVWEVAVTGLGGAAAGLTLSVLLLRQRAWVEGLPVLRRQRAKLESLFEALERLRKHPGRLLATAALSCTIRVVGVVSVLLLLKAVGGGLSFWVLLAAWPTAVLAGLLPFTLAGMGTRDAAFVLLVTAATPDRPEDAALIAGSLGYAVTQLWSFALLGLPFMLREAGRRRAASPPRDG